MRARIFTLLVALGLGTGSAMAQQTLSVTKDTVWANSNSYVTLKSYFVNHTAASTQVEWEVIADNLPSSITNVGFGICDNQLCYNYLGSDLSGKKMSSPFQDSMEMELQIDLSVLPPGPDIYYMTVSGTDGQSVGTMTFLLANFAAGIEMEKRKPSSIRIYPNPAQNELHVQLHQTGVRQLAIYNLIGKAVSQYRVQGNSARLDISTMPSGIYFLRMMDNKGKVVATRKFTKQ